MPGPLISSAGDKSGLYGPGESPAHPRWIIKGTYNSERPPLTGPWLITQRGGGADEVHCPTIPPSQPDTKPGVAEGRRGHFPGPCSLTLSFQRTEFQVILYFTFIFNLITLTLRPCPEDPSVPPSPPLHVFSVYISFNLISRLLLLLFFCNQQKQQLKQSNICERIKGGFG